MAATTGEYATHTIDVPRDPLELLQAQIIQLG